MSETAKPLSADELAAQRKEKEAKINARIAELKTYEGKTFVRNDGKGLPIIVKKYAGIFVSGGQSAYVFAVESSGHAAWHAAATDFLENHTAVEAEQLKTANSNEPV
jgi:hypothetical protein